MNIFNTAYVSNDNIRLKNNTNKIVFKEGITKISTDKIKYNSVRDISLPNSLEEIGEEVFRNNKIEKLYLPSNLKVIEKEAFRDNLIQKLILPENLSILGPLSFKNNKITTLVLNDNIKNIGYSAFQGNKIKELDLKNVEELENCAFYNNNLEKVILSDKLLKVSASAFQDNKLKEIDFKNVTCIGMEAFASNKIEKLIIPDTIIRLEPSAFKQNLITELTIGKGIDKIPNRCFFGNKLRTLEIPAHIKTLEMSCFAENEIENLILHEGLETIADRAFSHNNFTCVHIPSSVKHIGKNVFGVTNIYYDGVKIESELIKKYGSSFIIKIAQIKKIHKNFNFNNISDLALDMIPADNDSIKGLNSNIKVFETVYKELKEKLNGKVNYPALFKVAYVLGLFAGDKRAIDSLVYITKELTRDQIVTMTDEIKLTKFDKKFADTINNGLIEYNDPLKIVYIIPHFYNNLDTVKKGVLKVKENRIAKLNSLVKNQYREEYAIALEKLKKNKNKITLKELEQFITDSLFDFSKENIELKEYTHLFNGNIKKEDVKGIELIMNQAKRQEGSKFKEFEGQVNDYKYKWLDNKDPLNLVLGYLVNCCAKYKGAGQDIMIQSMVNPNLRNLVIYKGNEVVAKTTAYYNQDYILCNNIEVSDKFMHNYELSDREELFKVVLEGLTVQAKYLDVNEVRIGMLRNDLNRAIYELNIEIKHDKLLDNCKFNNYAGDANDPMFGQALIYKK